MSKSLPIPVLIRPRLKKHIHLATHANTDNILSVSKHLPPPVTPPCVHTPITKMALLNVRSLSNKYFLINDLISTHKLDFLLLTETWLDHNSAETTLIETSPPDFVFTYAPRPSGRGDGLATLFRSSHQCNQVPFEFFRF